MTAIHGDPILRGEPVPAWLGEQTGATLVDLVDRAAARTPDRTAYVIARGRGVERWTFRELRERSRVVASTLAGAGVEPGARVVTWAANDPWLVAAMFGAWRVGAAIVPLDLRMRRDVALRIGQQAGPVLTIADGNVDPEDAVSLGAPVLALTGDRLTPAGTPPWRGPSPRPDDLAEILFTSGTTSDPKGVELTHAQLLHSGQAITLTAGMGRERALAVIPLSHMYGQIVPILHGLTTGSQVTFLPSLTPKAIAAAMARDRVTVVVAVPQLVRLLLDGIDAAATKRGLETRLRLLRRAARPLPMRVRRLLFRPVLAQLGGSLTALTCGGAALPADLQTAWERMGVEVIQGYGTTECAAICGHRRGNARSGTVGRPLAGIEVRIARDGELLARGPNVMRGYWGREDATAEVLVDGWLHTGDAARVDERGDVVILGRTRDRIALPNGLNVYPDDVERELVAEGSIRAAVVLEAAPGHLVAVLVRSASDFGDDELEAAVAAANGRLAPHQRIRRWVHWPEDDLPRTHTLKVRRGDVAAWLSDSGDAPPAASAAVNAKAGSRRSSPAPTSTLDAVLEILRDAARDTGADPGSVTPQMPLEALQLDSLGRVALAMRLDEELGAPLDDDDLSSSTDATALTRLVEARRGAVARPAPYRWAHGRPAQLVRRLTDTVLLDPALRLIARPRTNGLEHVAALGGGALLCANHTSHLDAALVRHALPRSVRDRTAIAAAADYFFAGGPVGPLVALATGAFPFGRVEGVRAALDRVAELLDAGWLVIVFPEGTRSPSGLLQPFRPGIGLLAVESGVPVVPVHIRGAHSILPKGSAVPRRRGRASLAFGEALRFSASTSFGAATAQVEAAVRALERRAGA